MRFLKTWFSGKTPDMNFHAIDIFRGLASLWVVLFHSFGDHYLKAGVSPVFDVFNAFHGQGNRGVEIFFIISGYCIFASADKNYSTPLKFLKQRIKRIYPPYWASIVFGIVFTFLILQTGLTHSARLPNIYDLFISFPLLRQTRLGYFNGPYWTLTHEVHFYLLIFCSILVFRRKFIYVADFITIALIFSRIEINLFAGAPIIDQVLTLRSSWYSFYGGILIYRIIRDIHKPSILYHLFWVMVFVYYQFFNPQNSVDLFALSFMMFLLCVRPFDKKLLQLKIMKPFFLLGMISYSLYLTHVMIAPKIMGLIHRLFELNNTMVLLIFFGMILPLTLIISYYFYLFCERPFIHRKTSAYTKGLQSAPQPAQETGTG
ncbi:MAG: acyltransferase [Nitrospirae bacterium]|nr:acyltransferase [Nitrospirota bacterium]